jgi:hypothetical protein
MDLVVALLLCAYVVGFAWSLRILFRGMMHERHMALTHELGSPPGWWEYGLTAAAALFWPVPMLVCLAVDFVMMDDA